MSEAVDKLGKAGIFNDESPGLSPSEVRARARRQARICGQLGLIVVDYMQLMSGNSGGTHLASTGPRHRPPLTSAPDNHPVTQHDATMLLFDFNDPAIVAGWASIDDRVMGGISRSTLRHDPAGHAVFEGTVSLERNGGFASVRSSPAARGLPGAAACVIEIRGYSKQFKLSLITDDGFDGVNYQANFTPSGTDWQTLDLPLVTFRASFRGREVPGVPALDPARIRQVGLMIAARQAGPFALEIKRIGLA